MGDNETKRSRAAAGLGSTAALLAAAAGGASWYYARRIVEPAADTPADPPRPEDHVQVVAVEDGAVVLTGPGAAAVGTWGLVWPSGYAQIGPVIAGDGDARRPVTVTVGHLTPGTAATLDAYAYPPDPAVLGIPCNDVTFTSPVGELPAWEFPADGDTWIIYVHGRSAGRHEAFRGLRVAHDLGLPALAISYRNDLGAPRSPDNRCHLGATEWEDVEGAVLFALSRGARDVILVGYSMGGSCVAAFLATSTHANRVRGVVLEAPVLSWPPVLRQAARRRGLPGVVLPLLLPASMAVARFGSGIDWEAMRHLDRAAELRHPTLLIHGDADETVPVELADALAAARPDLITYLRVHGAGHVRSWNTDRDTYESALHDYLSSCLDAKGPPGRRRGPFRR